MKFLKSFFIFMLSFSILAKAQDTELEKQIRISQFVKSFFSNSNLSNFLEVSHYQKEELENFIYKYPDILNLISEEPEIEKILKTHRLTIPLDYGEGLKFASHLELFNYLKKKQLQASIELFSEYYDIFHEVFFEGNIDLLDQHYIFKQLNSSMIGDKDNVIYDFFYSEFKNIVLQALLNFETDFDPDQIAQYAWGKVIQDKALSSLSEKILKMPKNERLAFLEKTVDQSEMDSVYQSFFRSLARIDFTQSQLIQNITSSSFDIKNADLKYLAERLVKNYYNAHMPAHMKVDIFVDIFNLQPGFKAKTIEPIFLSHSGIVFQKAMQQFTNLSDNLEFKKYGDLIKSSLPFLDRKDVEYLFVKFKLTNIEKFNQVAAGTTAVGIIGNYTNDNIFGKILRPGTLLNIYRDKERLIAIADGDKKAISIIVSIVNGILVEVNPRDEAFQFILAKHLYHKPELGIHIPDIARELPINETMFFMKVAKGKPVSKIKVDTLKNPELKNLKIAYETLLDRWLEQSLYFDSVGLDWDEYQKSVEQVKDLYIDFYQPNDSEIKKLDFEKILHTFHGDPHEGNIFYKYYVQSGGFEITPIDWGSSHNLKLSQVRGQLSLLLHSINKKPEKMAESIGDIVKTASEEQLEILTNSLKEFIKLNPKLEGNKLAGFAISMALDIGINLPKEIIYWHRFKDLLLSTLKDVIMPEMKARGLIDDIDENKILTKILFKHIKRSLRSQVTSSLARNKAPVTLGQMTKFLVTNTSSAIARFCKSLFINPF
ncbi:MAG: hypothetical protein H6621_01960 [Halobacteriovoraceae bacterium]|nr:hypothetical protein [Halobacteriovoraceae bacterium]